MPQIIYLKVVNHPSFFFFFVRADGGLLCQVWTSCFRALQIFRIRISTHVPVKNDCVQERRFGLLNTGIYLILSGSSDRLMLPAWLSPPLLNEFLWLDMARPSPSTEGKAKSDVYISPKLLLCHIWLWRWVGKNQCGLVVCRLFLPITSDV